MSPKDRWEKLEKGRICFSCLEPRGTCANHSKVPKDLKCVQCALWGEPKILALFRIFCKRKITIEIKNLIQKVEMEKH